MRGVEGGVVVRWLVVVQILEPYGCFQCAVHRVCECSTQQLFYGEVLALCAEYGIAVGHGQVAMTEEVFLFALYAIAFTCGPAVDGHGAVASHPSAQQTTLVGSCYIASGEAVFHAYGCHATRIASQYSTCIPAEGCHIAMHTQILEQDVSSQGGSAYQSHTHIATYGTGLVQDEVLDGGSSEDEVEEARPVSLHMAQVQSGDDVILSVERTLIAIGACSDAREGGPSKVDVCCECCIYLILSACYQFGHPFQSACRIYLIHSIYVGTEVLVDMSALFTVIFTVGIGVRWYYRSCLCVAVCAAFQGSAVAAKQAVEIYL